jgi:NAD(P)-dependent dehydrogenase (short-subunit alcohol dehydrogenase family)
MLRLSTFQVTQLAYPLLKRGAEAKKNTSSVVFVSSVSGGPTAMYSGSVYAATKGPPHLYIFSAIFHSCA